VPAYEKLAAYLETLRPKALRNDGVWALPQGEEFYRYAIESYTTTTMSADEIHALGLAEVARIGGEMDRILTEAGYADGTLGERLRRLSAAPAQLYPETDEGRAQVLKDYQAIIDEISAGLDPYFGAKPKARVIVLRVPQFAEKTAPGAYYYPPPMDGSEPGKFFANLGIVSRDAEVRMRTLAYHEAVPGHHLQNAIATSFRAAVLSQHRPVHRVHGRLGALRRAARVGSRLRKRSARQSWPAAGRDVPRRSPGGGHRLHSKRWTREQAIDYMVENTGMVESAVVVEIERYIVAPGQALAYKVGMLKILELRERAKAALGSRFDIREFHDAVLKNGAMPLSVLERVIDAYVARKKAAPAA
jgi:uncharacterized protein (DUF885 family)